MIKDKVFQMFILGTGNLDYALKNNLGGIIFFTRDIDSEVQFIELIKELKSKAKTPLFLSIDQEGGRVERTENLHPRYLSPMYAFQNGNEFLANQTKNIAKELNSYGINMNFAPCIDVNSNPNNPIIGERAFSNKPEDVCKGYDIVSSIYKEHYIIPVIKHFPGHGNASKDSHKELPKINLSMKEMEQVHIQPFRHAIDNRADAIMVAHLHCTCFDKEEIPTSLSSNCIKYIRANLNYNGILISDDMLMKGVEKYGKTEACIMGIRAGLDMFIYRDSEKSTLECIEKIIREAEKDISLRENIEISYNRIISLKKRYNILNK